MAKDLHLKKDFFFLINYFKESGEYYTSAVVKWRIAMVSPKAAYYDDAISKLRGICTNGGQGSMPGLSSEGWDGFITIEQAKPKRGVKKDRLAVDDFIADGVPHLLITKRQD